MNIEIEKIVGIVGIVVLCLIFVIVIGAIYIAETEMKKGYENGRKTKYT